jgi:aryl-alcohol dehydrogenase-like predicted oxidoreductase
VYKVDRASAGRMVGRALDAGVNLFDTADAYAGGQSEEILGAALGDRRPDVILTTKVGFRTAPGLPHAGSSRRHLLSACEASLRRLRTEWIDLYLVHRFDPHTPLEETLAALDDLVRAGKVRYVGFSNWSAWQAAVAVGLQERHGWARFVASQVYYSAVGRDLEDELAPFAAHAEVGTMIWSPLAGGLLTGRYPTGGVRKEDDRLASFDILPSEPAEVERVLAAVGAIARERGASMAQVALAWLLAQPATSTVIVGASKPSQLDDNLGAVDLRLSDAELAAISGTRTPTYPRWFQDRMRDAAQDRALSS